MTIAPSDIGHNHSTPRYRLRKRWFVLAVISGVLFFAGWLVFFRDRSIAVLKLPDGRRFTIHKLTYGKEHSYSAKPATLTSAEIWANQWLSRIGRQITPTFPLGSIFVASTPTFVMWHTFDWSQVDSESTPNWIILTDHHGWRTAINTLQFRNKPRSKSGEPVVPQIISCQMPSVSSELNFELLNSKGDRLAATRIPYDVPKVHLQNWNVQSLPVSEKVGDMRVTLKTLKADWAKPETSLDLGDALAVTPQFLVEINGVQSKSWIPMTQGEPFFENPFDGSPAVASIESTLGCFAPLAQCTVSPFESAWKVQLPMICQNPEEVLATERIIIAGVSLEDGLGTVLESLSLDDREGRKRKPY